MQPAIHVLNYQSLRHIILKWDSILHPSFDLYRQLQISLHACSYTELNIFISLYTSSTQSHTLLLSPLNHLHCHVPVASYENGVHSTRKLTTANCCHLAPAYTMETVGILSLSPFASTMDVNSRTEKSPWRFDDTMETVGILTLQTEPSTMDVNFRIMKDNHRLSLESQTGSEERQLITTHESSHSAWLHA